MCVGGCPQALQAQVHVVPEKRAPCLTMPTVQCMLCANSVVTQSILGQCHEASCFSVTTLNSHNVVEERAVTRPKGLKHVVRPRDTAVCPPCPDT